ncbi:hypothetical protein BGX27_004372 [Mortierella sp. AM989]|nr:hypothetical protein BGX27_004372 [Mortierella sp. AM989]
MRGPKPNAKDPEEMEDLVLHRTIGASRIRSHSAKYGSHKINRHHHSSNPSSLALPSNTHSAPGSAGTTVSSYLENLPSVSLDLTPTPPPPRPPRPPGGMLGISNGRGMGYSRSLGSTYDSPLSIHSSFNGHVRSGANLYGGKSQISGLLPLKPSSGHTRPTTSVFPIQKALEIAMKESRLLAAASSKTGSASSGTGTGMTTARTFVRELRRTRHTRTAVITEHGPTPDISLDEDEDEDDDEEEEQQRQQDLHAVDVDHGVNSGQDISSGTDNNSTNRVFEPWSSRSNARDPRRVFMNDTFVHEHGDIRIQRPTATSFDSRAAYPGIAYVQHTNTPHSSVFSLCTPKTLRNVPSTGVWKSLLESPSSSSASSSASTYAALRSTSISSSSSSSSATLTSPYSHTSLDSFFLSSSTSARAPYQSHFSPVLSSSSTFTSEPHALFSIGSSSRMSSMSSSAYPTSPESAVHAVRELLDSYPAPSPYCVDDKKRSPLHFAAASGDLELVEFLLERGVRPDCGRDIAGNMPLHLAIISNRVEVVAALLKAGADMTLASPMTHKTPLDLAESRLSYLLSRAQESVKQSQGTSTGTLDLHNSQIATRSSFHTLPITQSAALLYQIRGIVNLLRPYVVRQQKLQHGERQKDRQKERSWDRAEKYMRQQHSHYIGAGDSSRSGLWRVDPHSDDNFGDMEDEDEEDDNDMDTEDNRQRTSAARSGLSMVDMDGDMELGDDEDNGLPHYATKPRRVPRRLNKRMNANETELALENLMNGLSLLEANRKQHLEQQQQQHETSQSSIPDIADGNLADSELDPRGEQEGEQEVDDALPDLLEQVQQVLQAIKLNEPST